VRVKGAVMVVGERKKEGFIADVVG